MMRFLLLLTPLCLLAQYQPTPIPGELIRLAPPFSSGVGAPSNPCGAVGSFYTDTGGSLYRCPSNGGNWTAVSSGTIPTIPSTTNVLKGDGAGNATDSKITFTTPATGSTVTIADGKTITHNATTTFSGVDGKTFTLNNSVTIAGTDGVVLTTPSTSFTAARSDAAQTFTGLQTFTASPLITNTNAGSLQNIPVICATVALTAQSASITATNLQCNGAQAPAGLYRMSIAAVTTSGQAGTGNVTFTGQWSPNGTTVGGAGGITLTLTLTANANVPTASLDTHPGTKIFRHDGTTNITYSTTYTSTGQYDLYIVLERLM